MTDSQFDQYGQAIEIVPEQTAAFTTEGYKLGVDDLPATLTKKGLATTETIKMEVTIDNGDSWFQAVDATGAVQFAETGKNQISIVAPTFFRLVKSVSAAAAGVSLAFGKSV